MVGIRKAVAKAGANVAVSAINAGADVAGKAARVAVDSGLAEEIVVAGAYSAIEAVDDFTHRQPSEEKLRRLASSLSKAVGGLERRFAKLSREIVSLNEQYRELGRHQLLKRGKVKAELHQALVLKYGFIDFVDIIFDRMEYGTELTRGEVEFYSEYRSYLKRSNLTDKQMERIEREVMSRHGDAIASLANCDIARPFELLRNHGKKSKKVLFLRKRD